MEGTCCSFQEPVEAVKGKTRCWKLSAERKLCWAPWKVQFSGLWGVTKKVASVYRDKACWFTTGPFTHTAVRNATCILNQDDLPTHLYPCLHLHTTFNNWNVYILAILNFITLKPTCRSEKWRLYVNVPVTSPQSQLSQINTLPNPWCNLAALLAPFYLTNHCSQQSVKSSALSLPTTLLHVWTSIYFWAYLMANVSWNHWPMPRKYFIFTSEMLLFSNPPPEYSYTDCFTNVVFFQKSAPEIDMISDSYSNSSSQSEKTTFKLCLNYTSLFTMWPSSAYFLRLDISATLIWNCYTVENKILVLNSYVN